MKNPDDLDRTESASSGRSGPSPALIGFLVVAVLTAVFILQNRERTELDFVLFEVHSRVWTSIAVSIALGVVLDRLFLRFWRKRRDRRRES